MSHEAVVSSGRQETVFRDSRRRALAAEQLFDFPLFRNYSVLHCCAAVASGFSILSPWPMGETFPLYAGQSFYPQCRRVAWLPAWRATRPTCFAPKIRVSIHTIPQSFPNKWKIEILCLGFQPNPTEYRCWSRLGPGQELARAGSNGYSFQMPDALLPRFTNTRPYCSTLPAE